MATKKAAEKKATPKTELKVKKGTLHKIPSSQIVLVEGFNVRHDMGDIKGLANQIEENGVKMPLRGRLLEDKSKDGKDQYAVTDGHRRLLAIQQLVKASGTDFLVPMIVEPKSYKEQDRILDLLLANDGKPLTLLEEAEVYDRLRNSGMKQADIARKASVSQTHVANCNILMTASDEMKKKIREDKVAASTVIELIKEEKSVEKAEKKLKEAEKEAGPDKKVSKKNISKGTPDLEKTKVGGKDTTKSDPVVEPKEKKEEGEVIEDDNLEKLERLVATLEKQEAKPKKVALDALKATVDWLKGDITAGELSDYYFEDDE